MRNLKLNCQADAFASMSVMVSKFILLQFYSRSHYTSRFISVEILYHVLRNIYFMLQ